MTYEASSRKIGYKGEERAAAFLIKKGYTILQKNFTVVGGEIDLIARKNGLLIFVEVKARNSDAFGEGAESFSNIKRKRIRRAIQQYLYKEYRDREVDYQVDLIEINGDTIEHHEDVE